MLKREYQKTIDVLTKYALIFVSFFFHSINLMSQQAILFSQQNENMFVYNPATTGVNGYTSVNTIMRQQYFGFDQSPRTIALTVEGRILKKRFRLRDSFFLFKKSSTNKKSFKAGNKGRVGLGMMLINDRNSLINRNGISFAYGYHIYIKHSQLSFGISSSVSEMRLNISKARVVNESDPVYLSGGKINSIMPEFNAGVFLLNRNYYVGIAAHQLLQTKLSIGDYSYLYKIKRQYILHAGYNFITGNFVIVPSFLSSFDDAFHLVTNSSCKFLYNDNFWFGFSYRSNKDLISFIGFKANNFKLVYAFEYPTGSLLKFNAVTNEIVMSFQFGSADRKFRWQDRY